MLHPVLQRVVASLVASLVVTFAVLDASALTYFIGSQVNLDVVPQVVELFVPATVILFVLTWVAGFFSLLNGRWLALVIGIIIGVLAAIFGVVGKVVSLVPDFAIFSDQGLAAVAPMIVVFATAATIAILTLGVWVNRSMRRVLAKRRGGNVALVRAPAANLAQGLVTHISRKKVNVDKADEQWDAYVETMQAAGFRIMEVPPRMDLADSVFVEDTVVILGDTAVLTSPGAESRRAEVEGTEHALRGMGLRMERITDPGTLDGGDVLKVGRTVYIGRGGRTNAEGIRQFRSIAGRLGYNVIAVPITKALHLKSAVTALPDGTVIGYPKLVDDPTVFDRFLPVPEAEGVAVVVVADDTVIMSSTAKKSIELVRELGYRVIPVDISEFEKLEGCVTCLSVRIRP